MTSAVGRGLLLLALQCLIVSSLAAKYAHDRATCPRVWIKTGYYDPELPIRGRYAGLLLEIDAPGLFDDKPLVENKQPAIAGMPQKTPCEQNVPTPERKRQYLPVWQTKPVRLEVHEGKLLAVSDPLSNLDAVYARDSDGKVHTSLQQPIYFFVPEHSGNIPQWQSPRGKQIDWWAEVTLPKKGPPRPIRLGIKRADGNIMPLPTA
jgi:hypothetical protein